MTETKKRWAWALTGSGHFFEDVFALIEQLEEVDIFASHAAIELMDMYKIKNALPQHVRLFSDKTASAVPVARFYQNIYHTLVMSPVSSNTIAKCVYGISDSLVSNVFAQAGKCRIPALVFPCDTAEELISQAPKGLVTVYPRAIDLDNVEQLKKFRDTQIAMSFAEFKKMLTQRIKAHSA